MSLDGYIAPPDGKADWIPLDPDVNFAEIWAQFDTLLMGSRTYDAAVARLGKSAVHGMKAFVTSRTLRPSDHPGVIILPELSQDRIDSIRANSKKDIWLFGGGDLFRSLLAMNQVDTVEVSIIPVLLGGGTSLLSAIDQRTQLKLLSHKAYPSGRIALVYEVQR